MSVRDELAAALKPLLPPQWRIVKVARNLDTISSPAVVMLKQLSFEPAPRAPRAEVVVSFVVTVIDPHEDAENAEVALDDSAIELFRQLQRITHLNPKRATKVTFQDKYLAYDIELELVTTSKEKTNG